MAVFRSPVKLRTQSTGFEKLKQKNNIGKMTITKLRLELKKGGLEKKQHDRIKKILRVLKKIRKEKRRETLKLDLLYNLFSDLQKRFRYEFEYFNLTSVAFSYTFPLPAKLFQEWDPLKNAADWLYQMSSWKAMLNVWEDFVVQFIVPKLTNVLKALEFRASGSFGSYHMVAMSATGFFHKLQDVLYHWLCSNPNLDEVVQWYLGWKGSLTTELQAHHRVWYELNMFLVMMHQASEDIEVGSKKAAAFYAQLQEEAEASKGRRVTSAGYYTIHSFIECYQYGFGNINVCVDSENQSIITKTKEVNWSLVSLKVLLEMHESSMTK
ncbi:hypothetical protein MKX03_027361 [Papaver bracteatum]|nr:hypothetical protein MKX03_027361 [Papaver bracteatum]